MLASEFAKRLAELIEVAGDVEVVVSSDAYCNGSKRFETAAIECQNVKPMSKRGQYRTTRKTNTETVIKVW